MLKTGFVNRNSVGLVVAIVAFLILFIGAVQVGSASGMLCPQNEFYANCGENCQTECSTLNEPCLIRHIKCPEGCYCNKGYARNASGKCVRLSECVDN